MNFTLEHVGKKILIHNTEGADWVRVGHEYTISRVLNKNMVMFEGIANNWGSKRDGSWSFVDDIKEEFNEGEKVILNKETISLRKGTKTVIKGFINDDKNKIVIEGIIPGGWVTSTSLTKIIDIEKYRIKKAIELLKDFGPNFMYNFGLDYSKHDILGKDLSEFKVSQEGSELVLLTPSAAILYRNMYTDKAYEPLEMYIENEKAIKLFNSGNEGIEVTQIANRNYREIKKGFDPDNEKSVTGFCQEYCRKGYVRIGQLLLDMSVFKIIKKESNETAQLPALPF